MVSVFGLLHPCVLPRCPWKLILWRCLILVGAHRFQCLLTLAWWTNELKQPSFHGQLPSQSISVWVFPNELQISCFRQKTEAWQAWKCWCGALTFTSRCGSGRVKSSSYLKPHPRRNSHGFAKNWGETVWCDHIHQRLHSHPSQPTDKKAVGQRSELPNRTDTTLSTL